MDEFESLRRENLALNEQVKRLVRTERRLTLNQQALDAQLRRLEALNRFTLNASRAETAEAILALAIRAVFDLFPYEQALGFLKTEPGSFRKAAVHYVPGCGEPSAVAGEDEAVKIPEKERFLCRPEVYTSSEIRSGIRSVAPFLKRLDARFPGSPAPDASLLVLPICLSREMLDGLILLRRNSPLSLLEVMPTQEDYPFLELLETHVSASLQNLILYRDAQEAIRMRDEFLSIASHELKTPMTSILLLLQSINRRGAGQRELSTALIAQLERQFKRLSGLVDQLLDVSRIQLGKLTPQVAEMDLTATAREVLQRFQEELSRSGSSLDLDAPESVIIRADPVQIEQVITHLISNAVKFGQGKKLEVRIEKDGSDALLSVRDHGIGIPSRDQKRIFDRFERAVSSQHFGGLGLGLYITRQILEQHGGSIAIESRHGEGSKFTVRLPRSRPTLKSAS